MNSKVSKKIRQQVKKRFKLDMEKINAELFNLSFLKRLRLSIGLIIGRRI